MQPRLAFTRDDHLQRFEGSQGHMRTIAIIDDDADSRLLVHAVLAGEYRLEDYVSAEQAVLELELVAPDLVLVDMALPGADGFAVLEWLRRAPGLRHVPVIAFTAAAVPGGEARWVRAGFDACVPKPLVDETRLLAAIRRLLGRRAASLQP